MNNWPDWAYHTSEDRPSSADPTQLKRAVFISLASGVAMANADAAGAVRIAETVMGYAAERTGTELKLALQIVGEGGPYREAMVLVQQAIIRESDAIRSAAILAEGDKRAVEQIDTMAQTFAYSGIDADLKRLQAYAKVKGVSTEIKLSADELTASKMIPKRRPREAGQGGRGGRGGPSLIPGTGAQEALAFTDGKRSVLDIRDAVSAEFGPQDTSKFIEFFKAQAASGAVEITNK
jgi:hypothetical protein